MRVFGTFRLQICCLMFALAAHAYVFIDVDAASANTTDIDFVLNTTALQPYFQALQERRFGDAIMHRYSFDDAVEENGTVTPFGIDIPSLVMEHLDEFLESEAEGLPETMELFRTSNNTVTDSHAWLIEDMLSRYDSLNTTLTKRAQYTTLCRTSALAPLTACKHIHESMILTGTTGINANKIWYYSGCYVLAPGSTYMTRTKFKSEAGLIIDDCQIQPTILDSYHVQGHIAKSSSRRKVRIRCSSTGCA